MALNKYHYIELDTKRMPRVSLQNIVAGETGNRIWVTLTNGGTKVNLAEKEDSAFIYRVCLRVDSALGTRRQDSAMENSGITLIDDNTSGDYGKCNIRLSKDSFTAGLNRCRLEIYSKTWVANDTLICSAEFQFTAAGNPTGENAGNVYPSLIALETELAALKTSTESARDQATTAAEQAEYEAGQASTEATLAGQKAALADAAAQAANAAASSANTAASSANSAASSANTAASSANTAASSANTAAQGANAASAAANAAAAAAAAAALTELYVIKPVRVEWSGDTFQCALSDADAIRAAYDARRPLGVIVSDVDGEAVYLLIERWRNPVDDIVYAQTVDGFLTCEIDVYIGNDVQITGKIESDDRTLPDYTASDNGKYLHINESTGALEWAALPIYDGSVIVE
jgi:hypothetical protein